MSNNGTFKRSALKVSTKLMASFVALLAVGFLGYHFGVFQEFIPNDRTLLAFIGFIVAMFGWGFIRAIRRGKLIDAERMAMLMVEDLIASDTPQSAKVRALLDGEMFEKANLQRTRVAQYFAGIARQKAVNPSYAVDIERHIEMLGDNLSNDLSGIAEAAASQTKFGFLGTLLGIVIGFADFDISAVTGSAEGAAAVLGALMIGLGIAVLTSVVGLIGSVLLRKAHFYLEGESIDIVTRLKAQSMAELEPVLNGPKPQRGRRAMVSRHAS